MGLRKFLYERRVPGVEDKGCDLCVVEENRRSTTFCQCGGSSGWKGKTGGGRMKKEYAWSNISTKSMLTSPKYAKKAAIFMKNTALLGQFKAKERG